jgi:Spy/CpxP family protein refolding chaperone
MSMRRLIWGFLVCFSMTVFVGQTLSQTRGRSNRNRLRNTNQELKLQALERQKLQLQRLRKQMGLGKSEKEFKSEKELMKQILRATEKQWKAIEAKVNKVRELRSLANVSIEIKLVGIGMGGGSMSGNMSGSSKGSSRGFMSGSRSGSGFSDGEGGRGGTVQKLDSAGGNSSPSHIYRFWRWFRPSQNKGFENLNEGEKICEELFRLLEDNNSESEEIRQKMEALRKFRQEAKKELAMAQQELRKLVTPQQEAALVMMQILD